MRKCYWCERGGAPIANPVSGFTYGYVHMLPKRLLFLAKKYGYPKCTRYEKGGHTLPSHMDGVTPGEVLEGLEGLAAVYRPLGEVMLKGKPLWGAPIPKPLL